MVQNSLFSTPSTVTNLGDPGTISHYVLKGLHSSKESPGITSTTTPAKVTTTPSISRGTILLVPPAWGRLDRVLPASKKGQTDQQRRCAVRAVP